MSERELAGRTILVTGGARRVGAAIARALAAAGADVVIHCHRSLDEAQRTAAGLRELGTQAWVAACDLGDVQRLDKFMDVVLDATGGRLDGIVNNASVYTRTHLLTASPGEIEAALHLHATAPLLLARRMAALGGTGDIVSILDARLTMYDAQHAAYHLGKRLLLSLTSMLALELAPRIRVNAVAPGAVLMADNAVPAAWERLSDYNPLRMLGTPEGVAGCVRFLMSTGFITGQTLYYDGGYHLKAATYG